MRPSSARSRASSAFRMSSGSIDPARPGRGSRPSSAPGDGGSSVPPLRCEFPRRPAYVQPVERLHRAIGLAMDRSECREIVPADEHRRAFLHRFHVEWHGNVPHSPPVERWRGAAIEDPVEIAPADAGEARVPVVGDRRRHPVTDTGCGPHQRVQAFAQAMRRQRFAMSTCAGIASAWTPASVRPDAVKVTVSPVICSIASSSVCCTDGPWSCLCQPMKGPPSYSIVSRQRVTGGTCPWGFRNRGAIPAASLRSGPPAGPSMGGSQRRRRRPSCCRRALRRAFPAALRDFSIEHLDPLADGLEPGAGHGVKART